MANRSLTERKNSVSDRIRSTSPTREAAAVALLGVAQHDRNHLATSTLSALELSPASPQHMKITTTPIRLTSSLLEKSSAPISPRRTRAVSQAEKNGVSVIVSLPATPTRLESQKRKMVVGIEDEQKNKRIRTESPQTRTSIIRVRDVTKMISPAPRGETKEDLKNMQDTPNSEIKSRDVTRTITPVPQGRLKIDLKNMNVAPIVETRIRDVTRTATPAPQETTNGDLKDMHDASSAETRTRDAIRITTPAPQETIEGDLKKMHDTPSVEQNGQLPKPEPLGEQVDSDNKDKKQNDSPLQSSLGEDINGIAASHEKDEVKALVEDNDATESEDENEDELNRPSTSLSPQQDENVFSTIPTTDRRVNRNWNWRTALLKQIMSSPWKVDEQVLRVVFGPAVINSRKTLQVLVKFSRCLDSFDKAKELIEAERVRRLRTSRFASCNLCPRDVQNALNKYNGLSASASPEKEVSKTTNHQETIVKSSNSISVHQNVLDSIQKSTEQISQMQNQIQNHVHGHIQNQVENRFNTSFGNKNKDPLVGDSTKASVSAINVKSDHETQQSRQEENKAVSKVDDRGFEMPQFSRSANGPVRIPAFSPKTPKASMSTKEWLLDRDQKFSLIYSASKSNNTLPLATAETTGTSPPEQSLVDKSSNITSPLPVVKNNGIGKTSGKQDVVSKVLDDSQTKVPDTVTKSLSEESLTKGQDSNMENRLNPPVGIGEIPKSSVSHLDTTNSGKTSLDKLGHNEKKVPDSTIEGALSTLNPGCWLSTSAIEMTLKIFQDLEKSTRRLMDGAYMNTANPRAIHDKAPIRDRGTTDFIFPLHFHNHWIVGHIDLGKKEVNIYDSYRDSNKSIIAASTLREFLRHLFKDKPDDVPWEREWKYKHRVCSEQQNEFDCGIIAIINAIHIFANLPVPTSLDEASCRLWRSIAAVIINGKFDKQIFNHDIINNVTPPGEMVDLNDSIKRLKHLEDEYTQYTAPLQHIAEIVKGFELRNVAQRKAALSKYEEFRQALDRSQLSIHVLADDPNALAAQTSFAKWKVAAEQTASQLAYQVPQFTTRGQNIAKVSGIVNSFKTELPQVCQVIRGKIVELSKEADRRYNVEMERAMETMRSLKKGREELLRVLGSGGPPDGQKGAVVGAGLNADGFIDPAL